MSSLIPFLFARGDNSSSPYTHGLAGVNQIGNYVFINALVYFFIVLAAVSLAVRVTHNLLAYLRHVNAAGPGNELQAYWTKNQTSSWPWLKRNLIYAPLWNKHHNADLKLAWIKLNLGTLPSRYHTLILAIYVLSNIAYCCVLDYSQENKAAVLAELRGRSGALAVINLVPTVLFALRNNPLIPLLHVSYDTFNLLHRWAGRVVALEAFLHVLAWAIVSVNADNWQGLVDSISASSSFQWGTLGLVLLLFTITFAWAPIRHGAYETFLNLHRVLVIFALVGIYVHLDKAKLPQLPYVQLVLCLWGAEWIFRSTRLILHNCSRKRMTKVTVEALPNEACRVTFDLVRPWKFRPGSHVHAYIPSVGLWSSHPFSVAWTEERLLEDADVEMTEDMEKTPKSPGLTMAEMEKSRPSHTAVSLVIKAKSGMTRKLFLKASAAPKGIITTWGGIEGPYGGHDTLDSYGTVVLFAAGVGITHQLGYVRHLLEGRAAGTVATRKVILVWTIPNNDCVEWVHPWMDEILNMPGRRDVLKLMLYVTKKSSEEAASGSGTVRLLPGRCKPKDILDKEFPQRVGAMAVTVCGPGAFADEVRDAARSKVELGSIDFVEESFTY